MYCGSVASLLTGVRSFVANPKNAFDNNKSGITAETVLFAIKNATTYNGVTNEGLIRINAVSFGSGVASANNVSVLRLRLGATMGGTATYTAIDGTTADNGVTITAGNSIVSANTVHTTSTGGRLLYALNINSAGSSVIDVSNFDIYVAPGEILTVSGFATASTAQSASLVWSEDI
jgi:hypothetical protein